VEKGFRVSKVPKFQGFKVGYDIPYAPVLETLKP
jgi:hypothetical protein